MSQIHFYTTPEKYLLFNDRKMNPNDSGLYQLVQDIAKIKNTTEKKINHIDVETDTTIKIGLLKYFLVGVTILTGIGELTAGRYYSMLERTNSGGR